MIVLLSFFLVGGMFVSASCHCDACFNSVCYKRTTIMENYDISGQIAIDREFNTLYYHIRDSRMRDYSCVFDLDHIILTLVPNVAFSFARAVDQDTHDLYISTQLDVQKFNLLTNGSDLLFNKTVWHMQFKDKLYYTEFSSKGIYTYNFGRHESVSLLDNYQIDDFIIDKNNDIYFVHDFAVYRLKRDGVEAKIFADEIYSLATDNNGVAYFLQPATRTLYKLDYNSDTMISEGKFESGIPYRAVFDRDNNMIYLDVEVQKLFLLTPEEHLVCSVNTLGSDNRNTQSEVREVVNSA